MVFDFASRPPEVNSALIYSGAGAGPLMAASSAFNNLSAELSSNAASYESVISQLTGSEWQGPSSEAMAAAAQPYITWLTTTSAQLQEAATKAMSSAAAYQTAYSCQHPARGHPRQPDAAGAARREKHPGPKHRGDRGQRGPVWRVLGSGCRRDVRLRRRLVSRRDADAVDPAGTKHQPSRAGPTSVGGQQCGRQQRRDGCAQQLARWPAKRVESRPPTRRPLSRRRTPSAASCPLSTVCSAHRSWATAFTTSVSRWPGTPR